MKSKRQIQKKYNELKKEYHNEVIKKGYSENMGDKYTQIFKEYIGDIYSYDYFTRLIIISLQDIFNYYIYTTFLFDYVNNPRYGITKYHQTYNKKCD